MGGDFAPNEVLKGALEALPSLHMPLLLVGPPKEIEAHVRAAGGNVEIVEALEQVAMDEPPLESFKTKKNSSIAVGARLVKEGRAKAFVSAGNTGAATATCHLLWRQMAGIHRPAIASPMPNSKEGWLLLDAGASPDIDPEHLVEFALMGRAYARKAMGRPNPKVHLINIGEEPTKGNLLAKSAHKLLAAYPWFAGNIEGKDLFFEECDVVVCDAFVGNVILKTAEGTAEFILRSLRDALPAHPIARLPYWPMRKLTAPMRKRMDYAEIGGSPLLGLNGLCTICHGRSNAKAIRNALLQTQRAIEGEVLSAIHQGLVEAGLDISATETE